MRITFAARSKVDSIDGWRPTKRPRVTKRKATKYDTNRPDPSSFRFPCDHARSGTPRKIQRTDPI